VGGWHEGKDSFRSGTVELHSPSQFPYNTLNRNQPMTTTFADYAAQQEARESISAAVLKHTLSLCEALRMNAPDDYDYVIESGRKYHKIIMIDSGKGRSVHAFVDKKTGSLLKSASWKAPAKGERYNLLIIKDREWLFENADWASAYLYKR
jgi:hypothetical protein